MAARPAREFFGPLRLPENLRTFSVEVDLVADMTVINPFDFFLEESAQEFPFAYEEGLERELKPFLEPTAVGSKFEQYLKDVTQRLAARTDKGTVNSLVEVNQRLQQAIGYMIRMEPGVQTPDQTLELRTGSCRDSSWLLVQLLRRLGLAARFVSGYLIQLAP